MWYCLRAQSKPRHVACANTVVDRVLCLCVVSLVVYVSASKFVWHISIACDRMQVFEAQDIRSQYGKDMEERESHEINESNEVRARGAKSTKKPAFVGAKVGQQVSMCEMQGHIGGEMLRLQQIYEVHLIDIVGMHTCLLHLSTGSPLLLQFVFQSLYSTRAQLCS